jgi:hypothetical protein
MFWNTVYIKINKKLQYYSWHTIPVFTYQYIQRDIFYNAFSIEEVDTELI